MGKILLAILFSGMLIFTMASLEVWADYLDAMEDTATWQPYNTIITDKEAKIVHDYHGILSMKWSIPHKDFIFERDGKICRARAFEIIKEAELKK